MITRDQQDEAQRDADIAAADRLAECYRITTETTPMDYTNDKGERLYFPSAHAAEMELIDKGFDEDDRGFYRSEPNGYGWTLADIRYNARGYFIRITVQLEN